MSSLALRVPVQHGNPRLRGFIPAIRPTHVCLAIEKILLGGAGDDARHITAAHRDVAKCRQCICFGVRQKSKK